MTKDLWTTTTLSNGAVVRHRRIPKLPRFGATNMGVGLRAYHLKQAGFHAEAEALIREFEIRTGMPAEENDDGI